MISNFICRKTSKTFLFIRANDESAFAVETHIIVSPIQEDDRLVFESDQRNQVNEHPYEPRKNAVKMIMRQIDYGFIASDGSHRTFVVVFKRLHFFAFDFPDDVFAE